MGSKLVKILREGSILVSLKLKAWNGHVEGGFNTDENIEIGVNIYGNIEGGINIVGNI